MLTFVKDLLVHLVEDQPDAEPRRERLDRLQRRNRLHTTRRIARRVHDDRVHSPHFFRKIREIDPAIHKLGKDRLHPRHQNIVRIRIIMRSREQNFFTAAFVKNAERKIKRLGENQMRDIDVRIISATSRDLRKDVTDGRFREDLFFRLNVIPIRIPPLRERKEDILPLAEFFLKKFVAMNQTPSKSFSKEALEKLLQHPWFGNVRELENTIERAVVLSDKPVIEASDLQDLDETKIPGAPEVSRFDLKVLAEQETMPADRVMKLYIKQVLEKNRGAKEKTAKDLKIDRKTLYRKLREMETERLL